MKQQKFISPEGIEVTLDKNSQICEIQPRSFKGHDLFSMFKGHPGTIGIEEVFYFVANV